MVSVQCLGTTQRGVRCAARTRHESSYCHRHRSQVPTTSSSGPCTFNVVVPPSVSLSDPKLKVTFITPSSPKKDQEDIVGECCICLDDIRRKDQVKVEQMGCKHVEFHVECLTKCHTATCPLCRAPHTLQVTGSVASPINDIPPEDIAPLAAFVISPQAIQQMISTMGSDGAITQLISLLSNPPSNQQIPSANYHEYSHISFNIPSTS